MISGSVVGNQGPFIRLVLRNSRGLEESIDGLVDTGFSGWLTLPHDTIARMQLGYDQQMWAILADGSLRALPSYSVTVIWDGLPKEVFVDELESEPLIGMRLLEGFRFTMDAVDGGTVQIERLP